MKKLTIPFLVLPLLLACGAETQKPSEPVRGPSVSGPTENKPAPAAAKPVPVIAEKPVEAAPTKPVPAETAPAVAKEKVASPLDPIECPEGTQYFYESSTEGCLTELADGRLVPTLRWKQFHGQTRDSLLKTYREYKDGLAHGTWKAWSPTGFASVTASFQEGKLVKMTRYLDDEPTVVAELEMLPGGPLTKLKKAGGILFSRQGDTASFEYRTSDGLFGVAALKNGKYTFTQGSPSLILVKGMYRGDLGRFAHAAFLTSHLSSTQSFEYLESKVTNPTMKWRSPGVTLNGYWDLGDEILRAYTKADGTFDFEREGITLNFRKDPETAVVTNLLHYYDGTERAFLESKFPSLPFQH